MSSNPRLVYAGLADGAMTDLRGAMTVVGFDVQVIGVEACPASIAPNFLLVVEGERIDREDGAPRSTVTMQFHIVDESGTVLFLFNSPETASQPPTYAKGSSKIVAALQPVLNVPKPGRYEAKWRVEIKDPDQSVETVEASRYFWVDLAANVSGILSH